MNNKIAIFLLGVVTGGAAGAAITYFATRESFARKANEICDNYADSCRERIDDIVSYYEAGGFEEDDLEDEDFDDAVEDPRDAVSNNEGVKKYHRYSAGLGDSETAQKVFSKKVEDDQVTEGEKALVRDKSLDDVQGVVEIDENDFLNDEDEEGDYYKEYLRYDYNRDILYWGYGSDNEMEAEAHFGKTREELIGKLWRWAPDYVKDPDEMEGAAYVRNENLKTDFEIIIHYDPNEDVVEVSGD